MNEIIDYETTFRGVDFQRIGVFTADAAIGLVGTTQKVRITNPSPLLRARGKSLVCDYFIKFAEITPDGQGIHTIGELILP